MGSRHVARTPGDFGDMVSQGTHKTDIIKESGGRFLKKRSVCYWLNSSLFVKAEENCWCFFFNFQNGKFQMFFFKKNKWYDPLCPISIYFAFVCSFYEWKRRESESKLHWLWKTLPLGKQLLVHTRYIPLKKILGKLKICKLLQDMKA